MLQPRTNINDERTLLQIDGNYNINELEQVKYCLKELNKLLSVAARTLGKSKEEFEGELFEEMYKSNELEQEKILLLDMNESFAKRVKELEKGRQEVETKLRDKSKTFRELEQEKMILKEVNKYLDENETISKEIFDSLSHELRTPVVTIKAYIDMLLNDQFGELTEQQKEKLERVKGNIDLLIKVIFQMLEKKESRK